MAAVLFCCTFAATGDSLGKPAAQLISESLLQLTAATPDTKVRAFYSSRP
jgi:hypothetical protein